MENFGTYIHARPGGEAFYVGKGSQSRAFNLNPRNPHHGNIVAKYGKENIVIDFVLCESEAAAFDLEIKWIKTLRLFGVPLTNMTDGGDGVSGLIFSSEARLKLSEASKRNWLDEDRHTKLSAAMKGNTYRRGKVASVDTKAKMSVSRKGNQNSLGFKHTAENNSKNSARNMGNTRSLGHKHSDTTKAKMSANLKGNTLTKGNIWINNGVERHSIKAGEVIPTGYKRGMALL